MADPDVEIVVIATPHDTHADLAVRALRAGKHVWCEKPLALTLDELENVEAAAAVSGTVLFVGFNRRYSPLIRDLASRVRDRNAPAVLNYRVSAGPVPDGHWYGDRRQGGRLLGEVCHFIDTCCSVLDSPVVDIAAMSSLRHENLLSADHCIVMSHAEGSLSTLTYASGGHPGTAKERLELLADGSTYVVDDFRQLRVDGDAVRRGAQDKGHTNAVRTFQEVLQGRGTFASPIPTMRATLLAAGDLTGRRGGTGRGVDGVDSGVLFSET